MRAIHELKMKYDEYKDLIKFDYKEAFFNSKTATIANGNQVNEAIKLSIQQILKKIGQWLSEGSG